VVRLLRARHRLCLTGTPMENHLGELWAQFDFLLPGFLGESKDFTRAWRTPIEKHGDTDPPRTAGGVASPLHPAPAQGRRGDRTAAEDRSGAQHRTGAAASATCTRRCARRWTSGCAKKIASRKGFARSRIVILDALLKLRQVCCDPRLLKTDAALRVKERAKLDLLMDMLENLLAEGRKVLVFSQFTAMLDLIKSGELDEAGIGSVMLTGDTTQREAVVRRFQEGTVPVFLISLKAGGVGLNLTAPTPSSTTTPGGTPPPKTRPATARTASARTSRCSYTS
jgi:SNF2 family DNA or RNA helicase